jgi:hypothetical protein
MLTFAEAARGARLAAATLCLLVAAGCGDQGDSKTAAKPADPKAGTAGSLDKAKDHAIEAAKQAGEKASELGEKAVDATKEAATQAGAALQKAGEKAKELSKEAVQKSGEALERAGETVKDATK